VVAQTDDPTQDAAIAADARAVGAIAYAHDLPDRSDFAMPAVARRGPLAVAVSTDAVAPALSRRVREQLDALLESGGAALDALIAELESARQSLPRGERGGLYDLSKRLRIAGAITVDDD
jgi:siroheme synthase-like protein